MSRLTPACKTIIAITVLLTSLATAAVVLRNWARIITKQAHRTDDYLAYAALVTLIALVSIPLIVVCAIGNIGEASHETCNWCIFMLEVCCWIPLALSKSSLVFLYRRIFRGLLKPWVMWSLIGIITAWALTYFLISVTQCKPYKSSQESLTDEPHIHCTKMNVVFIVGTAMDVVLDVILLIIPAFLVVQLNMATSNQIAVIGVFMLGALTLAASIARMIEFILVSGQPNYGGDLTYFRARTSYWSLVEATLSVTAVCLPCLMPIVRKASMPSTLRSFRSPFSSRDGEVSDSDHKSSSIDSGIIITTSMSISSHRTDPEGHVAQTV